MRKVVVAMFLGLFLTGCSEWFDSPSGSNLEVFCQEKASSSAGVRCGDETPPAVPE